MQMAFNVNMVALVDGTPQTLNLKQILTAYIRHRQEVVTRRAKFELEQARARAHILEGLKIALDHLDAVIKTIRESKDADAAKENLMRNFKLSEIQAQAILDMQLRRLAALERQKIEDEYKEVLKTIAYLEDLLASPKKILGVIETELKELKEKYGDERRTRVYSRPVGDFSEEDLIPAENVIVTVTETGYIKRAPTDIFRTQARGGRGVSGATLKEEDTISQLYLANTHDNMMFFTNKGRVFQIKVYELPEGSRISKGQAIINLINIEPGELVTSMFNVPKSVRSGYIFMGTKKGIVKKTKLEDFANIRRSGIIAINLNSGDSLNFVTLTSGTDEIIMVTRKGQSIRFSEKGVREMGRATAGVMGIRLATSDEVICASKAPANGELLVVTEKGFGKKSKVSDWPLQGRAGSGVKAAEVTSRNGQVMAARVIEKDDQSVVITSKNGQVIKLPIKDVPLLTRQTQGVILIRLSNRDDVVSAVTTVKKEEAGEKPT
jgi:DNA gyrase subunit A